MTHPISLLLVDDDDAFRLVMAGELGHRGFEVTVASSGAVYTTLGMVS